MKTNSECIEIIKGRLTEKRFIHSLNVAESAKELAIKFGADPEKAYTAGLIHDSCKNLETSVQLKYLLENNVELSEYELAAPKLFHAICGKVFAEKELGCDDEEILTAIRYHTTGRSNMTLLEKVIFIDIDEEIAAKRVINRLTCDKCKRVPPQLSEVAPGHFVQCNDAEFAKYQAMLKA